MSISLSTKKSRLSNIFWWINTLPRACVATTRMTLSKSGVKPGHGASAIVMIEPSMKVSISYASCVGTWISSPSCVICIPNRRNASGMIPSWL